jgi:hypothetical protein
MVAASEGSLLGREEIGPAEVLLGVIPAEVLSGGLMPAPVASVRPGTGRGKGAELSPLDTATPSGARRAAASRSPAIYRPPLRLNQCVRRRLQPEAVICRVYPDSARFWPLSQCTGLPENDSRHLIGYRLPKGLIFLAPVSRDSRIRVRCTGGVQTHVHANQACLAAGRARRSRAGDIRHRYELT